MAAANGPPHADHAVEAPAPLVVAGAEDAALGELALENGGAGGHGRGMQVQAGGGGCGQSAEDAAAVGQEGERCEAEQVVGAIEKEPDMFERLKTAGETGPDMFERLKTAQLRRQRQRQESEERERARERVEDGLPDHVERLLVSSRFP